MFCCQSICLLITRLSLDAFIPWVMSFSNDIQLDPSFLRGVMVILCRSGALERGAGVFSSVALNIG